MLKFASAMTSNILRGKELSDSILQNLKLQIQQLQSTGLHSQPGLAYILVGSKIDSTTYIKLKRRACDNLGIQVFGYEYEESVAQQELIDCIKRLNTDPSVHGVIVQLPLPPHIHEANIINTLTPEKDVDGLTSSNFGDLVMRYRNPLFYPCTPIGCIELLKHYSVGIAGKHAVVVGRSDLAGIPLAALFNKANATTTICHSYTRDLHKFTQSADILAVAAGQPGLIKQSMVKPGCIVLDIGINSLEVEGNRVLVGDCDFEGLKEVVSGITPVPNGVGPMTIAMLLKNVVTSWKNTITNS